MPQVSGLNVVPDVLPPLARDAATNERDPGYIVTLAGLLLSVVLVTAVIVLRAT